MSNVIKEYQDALNTTPPLKVDIAPAFTPPEGVQDPAPAPTPTIPASAFPSAPTQTAPLPEQPQIQPTRSTLLEVPPTPTGEAALAAGETVSRLSAQSAQEIQKILAESGQPKPNEVQKQLFGSSNPVQIDPKLTSQNNPFASGSEPRNSAERLAFEPPRLANGMLNPFSDANAIAALQAGIPKGEYLSYKRALEAQNKTNSPSPIFNFGLQDKVNANFQQPFDSLVGLNADQIRQKMRSVDSFGQAQSSFNRNFMPFLGEDRGSVETLFGLLALPANLVKGVVSDAVLRPSAALISGGFNAEEIAKAYEAIRPTRGGTYTGAAVLGEQFTSMAPSQSLIDKNPSLKPAAFNPFGAVYEDTFVNRFLAGGLDISLDPLNAPIGQAFARFRRSAVTPPSIIPEVLPPVRELPPSNVAGVLPEARTIDVSSVVDSPITPKTPPPERVLVTPTREAPSRVYLPESTVTQDVTTSQTTVGRTVAQSDRTSLQVTERPLQETPQLGGVSDNTVAQDKTVFQVVEKRAEPQIAGSYDSLVRYEPSEVVFPVPREPYSPPVIRYHGSSSPVTELKNDFFNKDNIYGNGFYTTRDRSVAETYQKKGASEGTGEGYLYQVDSSNDKLFNLDDVIPAQIRESVRLNAPNSGRLGILYKEAERLLNGGKGSGLGGKVVTTTTELFDSIRRFSKRVEVETGEDGFAKFVDSFKPELQKSGYTGFTHEGGRLTRGKRHQVDILWSPETSVKLSQLDVPKVEPADVQLYNNVTALFNDSPELPVAQNLLRAVVEQTPTPQTVYQNRILQEVAEYGRTGELTPNIAVLKGATPDEVRAIVQDKLEVMRDTPFVVPRLEVQPITVPKLEFDITRQLPRRSSIVEATVTKLTEIQTPVTRFNDGVTELPKVDIKTIKDSADKEIQGWLNLSAENRRRVFTVKPSSESTVTKLGFTVEKVNEALREAGIKVVNEPLSYKVARLNASTDKASSPKAGAFLADNLVFVDELVNRTEAQITSDLVKKYNRATPPKAGIDRSKVSSSVVDSTSSVDLDMIADNTSRVADLEYLAAKRAAEINPNFESVRAYIVDEVNEAALLAQLDIIDGVIPVPASKPVVTTDSAIVTVTDLQDAAKGIGTLGEVSQWSVRGDFLTPLKDVLNAVDDLGLGVLNTPALSKMVKGGIGKLSNKTVEGVASSLQKVSLETAEDIAKSIFNALWRKSTPDQKEIILGKISATRLEQLGLERVQTKIVSPTTPAPLQYVQAGVLDDVTVSAYQVVNDSQIPIEQLRVSMLREQGFDGRTASSMKEHPLSRSISEFGEVYDEDLIPFLKSRELSISTPTEQKWSSKMLQQIWEVATPQQKAYIMKNVDNLEQLGLERIARSNVIDDHLPPEGVFDTPC